MLEWLKGSILMSTIHFDMNQEKIHREMGRYVIGKIYQNVNDRIYVVDMWIFAVKFFQLSCMFKNLHKKFSLNELE